jgi:predicted RNA polymerase sigma factor
VLPVESPRVEDLLRELAPQVLGTLVRRHGQFDVCEDAVQEALLAASRQWSEVGIPENPRSWLTTTANRRLVDGWRSESARRRREETAAVLDLPGRGTIADQDDTLTSCSCAVTPRCPRPRSSPSRCARSAG